MAYTADKVIVELEAKLARYNADVERSRSRFERAMDRMHDSAARTESRVSRAGLSMSTSLVAVATALSGGVAIRQVQQLADRYTRLQNAIAASGAAADQRRVIEDRLYAAGARNGAQAEALAQLYRRAAQAGDALGASQEQLLRLTDGVAAALRVEGVAAQEARGPLLQLGQALASPIVRAEEINSVLEGTPEIARAAARGLGVTVAELRRMVVDGDLSNVDLFQGLLRGLEETERRAQNVSLTIGNATTVLFDALSRYIGQADNSLGATERLTAGIIGLANNLDTVAGLATAVATVFGARFGAQLIAGLGREIAATRQSIRAHNDRIQVLRGTRRAELESAEASTRTNAARLTEIRTTQNQIAVSLQQAQAQRAQALAYVQLQQGLVRAGAATGQLTNAKNQLAIASRNVIRLQRLERQLAGELTAATAAHTAATRAATVAQGHHNAILARTGILARTAAAGMGVLRGAMAFLGGPIGVAITAVAAGVALIAHRSGEAERRADRLASAYRILGQEVDEYGEATERATRIQRALAVEEERRALATITRALAEQRVELRRLTNERERLIRETQTREGATFYIEGRAVVDGLNDEDLARKRERLAEVNELYEEQNQVVLDLADGEAALREARDRSNTSTRRALDLTAIQRRANQGLTDALDIVAGAMGETGDAQRLLNELERESARIDVEAALVRQEAALSDVETALRGAAAAQAAYNLAASLGTDGPENFLGDAPGTGPEVDALEAEAAIYRRRIELFREFLQALEAGQVSVGGASAASREREERLRREARAIEDSITREQEFAIALEETRAAIKGGDINAYTEQVQRLTQEQSDAATQLRVLEAQYEAGTVKETEYRQEAERLAAVMAQLREQMEQLQGLTADVEGAKAADDERIARERLNAAIGQQLDHELSLARLRGDDAAIRRLERELYVRERIAEIMADQGLTRDAATTQANREAGEIDAARRYGEHRELFARSFSDGIRAAMSGDLRNFLANSLGSVADEALQRLGGQVYDALFDAPADIARATAEGAAKGTAAAAPMGTAITTSGTAAANAMREAITTAGLSAARAMAAAVNSGGGGGAKNLLSGVISAVGGKALPAKAPVTAGAPITPYVPSFARAPVSSAPAASAAPIIVNEFHLHAEGAVLTDELLAEMDQKAQAAQLGAIATVSGAAAKRSKTAVYRTRK